MAIALNASPYLRRTNLLPSSSVPWTIMGWAWVSNQVNEYHDALSFEDTIGIGLHTVGGTRRFSIGSNTADYDGTTAIALNRWYHIALVRSGTSYTLYLDGVVERTATDSVTPNPHYLIGRWSSAGSGTWIGRVAHVKIWEQALTADQVRVEMRTATWRVARPKAWYPLWAPGSQTEDWSGNGLTLTVSGTTADADGPPVGSWWRPALAVSTVAAGGGGATYTESLTLTAQSTQSPSSTAIMSPSVLLTGQAAQSGSGPGVLVGNALLSAQAAETQAGTITASALLALAANGTITPSASVLVAALLDLGAAAAVTPSAEGGPQAYTDTLALSALSTLLSGSTAVGVSSVPLSAQAGSSQTGTATMTALHAYAATAGISPAAVTVIAQTLALGVVADMQRAAAVLMQALVALDATSQLTAATTQALAATLTLAASHVFAAAATIAGAPVYDVLRIAAEQLRAAAASNEALSRAGAKDEALGRATAKDESVH
jgi:hypothetical protein